MTGRPPRPDARLRAAMHALNFLAYRLLHRRQTGRVAGNVFDRFIHPSRAEIVKAGAVRRAFRPSRHAVKHAIAVPRPLRVAFSAHGEGSAFPCRRKRIGRQTRETDRVEGRSCLSSPRARGTGNRRNFFDPATSTSQRFEHNTYIIVIYLWTYVTSGFTERRVVRSPLLKCFPFV